MSPLEETVCLIQQYAAAGLEIVSTDPLEVEGPDQIVGDFAEVVTFLRELADFNGKHKVYDAAIMKLRTTPKLCTLGGCDWEAVWSKEWAFTRHEQRLLRESLGGQVWYHGSAPLVGRLEGIRPGWCFVTLGSTSPALGSPVCQFIQRTESAVKLSSLKVENRPPVGISPKPPEQATDSMPALQRREEVS